MIVRWSLGELPGVLDEIGAVRPLLVASPRWDDVLLPIEPHARWSEVPSDRVAEAAAVARAGDGIVVLGGGSAIDFAKAVSAETKLPLVSVPTTYSGAEWTPFFGIRDRDRRARGGGAGANLAAVVYAVELTLALPRAETGGTALNALAHCAEALYVSGRNPESDRHALAGAARIAEALPRVLSDGSDVEARTLLLDGAMHAGAALAGAGLGLAHAMAQALGGRYGISHGALNALCLPPALRFNEPVARDEIRRLADAMGVADAAAHAEQLALSSGFERLRDLGVPADELDAVAEAAAARAGARANPRSASAEEIGRLLREIW